MTLISVVIPTRDRPHSVADAVGSVFAGTYQDFELYVVDQSGDETTYAALAAFHDEPRFRYARNRRPGVGAASSRNMGIALCNGEIVAIIDDDVTVRPDWLATIAAEFAADPALQFICGKLTAPPYDWAEGFTPAFDPAEKPLSNWTMPIAAAGANFSMRRVLLDRIGGYDELCGPGSKLGAADDGDLAFRIARSGAKWKASSSIEVVHTHGFRPTADGAALLKRYRRGVGGHFGRFTRRGDIVAGLWFLQYIGREIAAALLRSVPRRKRPAGLGWALDSLVGFWRGLALPPSEGFVSGADLRQLRAHLTSDGTGRMVSGMQPSRVLFLPIAGEIGGTARIVVSLARAFAARGWDVQIALPESSPAVAAWCREQGVEATTHDAVKALSHRRTWGDVLALRRFIRASNAQVVNLHYGGCHAPFKDVLAACLAGGTHCVVTINHPARDRMDLRRRATTRLAGLLAHSVVVISTATRDTLLLTGIPARKITVIPCGVRAPAHLPARDDARARLGLDPDAFVISFLSRLEPEKGPADLVEAAALVHDPDARLRVVFAGDGPERRALEQRAAACLGSRALFLGRVQDIDDVFAAADVFVLPSYLEGFGIVYVEAAFHGVPSIGTTAGGIPEVVVDGETGLLVRPGDTAALAAAIERLRDDPELLRRMGEAACTRAHAAFSEEQMGRRYYELYHSAICRQPGAGSGSAPTTGCAA